MTFPKKYPYKSKWSTILISVVFFGASAVFMPHIAMHPEEGIAIINVFGPEIASRVYWMLFISSLAFIGLSIFAAIRRFTTEQFIELQQSEIRLPRGAFKTYHIVIPYSAIDRIKEVEIYGQKLLFIIANSRQYKIPASLLPSTGSYAEIKDFLVSVAKT